MKSLFSDQPEAIINIQELVEKIESYTLSNEILLPRFEIPKEFVVFDTKDSKIGENNYLKHLVFRSNKNIYAQIIDDNKGNTLVS